VITDNPNLESDIGSIRRSLRLHLVESDILRNESDQNTNDFCLLEVLGIALVTVMMLNNIRNVVSEMLIPEVGAPR
jgi:hypothetical protein